MHAKLQFPNRPAFEIKPDGVCIAIIYGFAGREHMKRNLLHFLRESGYANTTMYGHLQAPLIADDLQQAAAQQQTIVVVGFSQGGLEAVRVANKLQQRGVTLDLLVTIAAGGAGRWWPHRWHDDPRRIPANVERCLNYFSVGDMLGSDKSFKKNLAYAENAAQCIENIHFDQTDSVSHLATTKTYPAEKVHPQVQTKLLQRLQAELATF